MSLHEKQGIGTKNDTYSCSLPLCWESQTLLFPTPQQTQIRVLVVHYRRQQFRQPANYRDFTC